MNTSRLECETGLAAMTGNTRTETTVLAKAEALTPLEQTGSASAFAEWRPRRLPHRLRRCSRREAAAASPTALYAASTTVGAAQTGMSVARLIRASSCVIACLALAAPTALHADPVHSETGNYCVDKAKDVLQQSFGPDVRITQAQILPSQGLDTLWVKSNLCKGYFVFPALGNDDSCTMPAYISAPRSSFGMMWGYGDCATLVEEAARKGDRHEAKAPDLPGTSATATSP
jgi:hypothetical protein